MKTLLRTGFVALIALGLASQALRASRGDDEGDAKAALIGRAERLQVQLADMPGMGLLLARSPLCAQPFVAGLMQNDGTDDETMRRLSRPEVRRRYVYLGVVEEHPSRTELLARWGWAALRFHAGLRRAMPSGNIVIVAYPRSCTSLDAVDWAALSP